MNKAEIISFLEKGMKAGDIGRMYGVNGSSFRYILPKCGIYPSAFFKYRRGHLDIIFENRHEIIQDLKDGRKIEDIADDYGIPPKSFQGALNRAGIKIRQLRTLARDAPLRDLINENREYITDRVKIGVKTRRIGANLKWRKPESFRNLSHYDIRIREVKHPERKPLDTADIAAKKAQGKSFREIAEEYNVSTNIIAAHYYNHIDKRTARNGRSERGQLTTQQQ